MNTRMKKFGIVVGAALVGVLTFSAISFAQTPDTSTSDAPIMERIQQGVQNAFERGGPGGRGGNGGPGGNGEVRGMKGGDHQEALAAALGMTTEELQTALLSGQTIEEIAAEKGVDLQAFALTQAQEQLAQAVTDGKLTQEEADAKLAEIQTAIENGEFPGQRGFGPGQNAPRGERNSDLAEALGMTQEELHTAIQNGQTIEEIAAEKGVDLEALQAEQQAEKLAQAQERLAQAVEDGKLTQEEADQILEQMQSGERPEFGGRGGPGGQRAPRGGENSVPFEAPANPNL